MKRFSSFGLCALSKQSHSAALSSSFRWQTRIPNKGYRVQEAVPDRLKDAVSLFGNMPPNVKEDKDPAFVPEEQRSKLYQSVLSDVTHMKVYGKLDRLRTELENVRNCPAGDERWKEVYLFMRTTEMCCELMREQADTFPQGQKLWVELEFCEEQRVPTLLELPNGMIVLPIFSMEEYLDFYFSRVGVFESSWFPHPKNGSQWDVFCGLEFPVCGIGSIEHMAMLGTVALGGVQVAVLLNPGQSTSKFITYPEMVHLSKAKRMKVRDRSTQIVQTDEKGNETFVFDKNTMVVFNTSRWELKRVLPQELPSKLKDRPPIPPIAQMELHLLLYPYPEITHVFVRSVLRPKWRRMMGGPERMTQIDVVSAPGRKPDAEFFEHLKRWSYMREFNSEVHVELTDKVPEREGAHPFMCVYRAGDGDMLRDNLTYHGMTISESLAYNEPLAEEELNTSLDDMSVVSALKFRK